MFEKKKILVVGAGISGVAAIKLLCKEQAILTLYDGNDKLTVEDIKKKLPKNYPGRISIGRQTKECFEDYDFVVVSPGVPTDLPFLKRFLLKGVPVFGEVELAYHFSKGKIVGITGTNGKTTTTALTGEIMKTIYSSVFVVGNIGIPYTEMVEQTRTDSVTVAEMSSFQLESIQKFRPEVSMILNLTPDHLDRHHTMDGYLEAKANILKNQTASDTCVLNYEDPALLNLAKKSKAKVIWFSSQRRVPVGLFLHEDEIYYTDGCKDVLICRTDELNIIGRHNYENVMAAAAAGLVMSVPVSEIQKALCGFHAVEHRIEYVATKAGVRYYNDSKGTNPDASIQAVNAMTTKTWLIGGGYDKGSDYTDWIKSFEGKVKFLVLMGETAEKIADAARKQGFDRMKIVGSMEEAIEFCSANAVDGEAVLLSPCCASWGMFKNYEERGRVFKGLVNAME